MISTLITYRNEKRIASLDLKRIGSALSFSKEDVELYFFMLSVISSKYEDEQVRKEATKFLLKQNKLQNVLNDLLERYIFFNIQWNTDNAVSRKEITQQLIQLEQEFRIFNELHFRVKRTYIRFANEHFQVGWGQSYMVA